MLFGYLLLPVILSAKLKINTSINSNIEDLKADRLITKEIVSTAVPPLSGNKNNLFAEDVPDCVDFTYSNFKFHVCPFDQITQTSLATFSAEEHNLGVYSGFEVIDDQITGMNFWFGDINGCKGHRETFIKFACGNDYRIVKFNEVETCRYEGEMRFPSFCDPDRRLIYPILTQNGKKLWRQLRAAINENIITDEGIEFYKNKILTDEGLRLDKAFTVKSQNYVQWLRSKPKK
jgi:hypothetical protein